jgi:Rps23 Pro-64 3,4-dihydroxylase Tpa1-like proline 4-hydroxylase
VYDAGHDDALTASVACRVRRAHECGAEERLSTESTFRARLTGAFGGAMIRARACRAIRGVPAGGRGVLMSNAVPSQTASEDGILTELLAPAYTDQLQRLAVERAEEYQRNKPFPNIHFDNFLPVQVAEAALRAFPEPEEVDWHAFRDANQYRKLAFDVAENLPVPLRDVLLFLNTRPMLQFLETLTGIKSIVGDPYYVGGGLHQIKPGGLLEVHADFSYHKQIKLDRRINVLIYLNKDWKEEYGGAFELWNREITRAEVKIAPLFNRCAIFSTTSSSFHGHPHPLTCPPDRTRKSIATYYYSNGRPEETPELTHRHEVAFQRRQGFNRVNFVVGSRKLIRSLLPPIITDIYHQLRRDTR